jgi:hypothetical protein
MPFTPLRLAILNDKVCNCLEDYKISQILTIILKEGLTVSFGNSMVCVPAVKQMCFYLKNCLIFSLTEKLKSDSDSPYCFFCRTKVCACVLLKNLPNMLGFQS